MAQEIRSAQDLIRLLRENPELRDEVRRYVLTEELLSLPALIRDLSGNVVALAEAQRRSEERLDRLEAAVERLAEAMMGLQQAVAALQKEVGTLSNVVGGSIETDLDDVLPYIMRQKGYRVLGEPRPISFDGEVDVVLPVQSPDGRHLWAVAEAKVRLRRGDVFHLAAHLGDPNWREMMERAGVSPPYIPYAYGLRVYPDAVSAGEATGVGILSSRGEVLPPKEAS
ncbi:MAG TPA: hypothetical protein VNL95_03470 [Dehalococcoidia bacterium]|nr:hypothetical protein [Dehalococcoidia bacterium]